MSSHSSTLKLLYVFQWEGGGEIEGEGEGDGEITGEGEEGKDYVSAIV